jgi:hypothetical protein
MEENWADEDETSEPSAMGTGAHFIGETCLHEGTDPDMWLGYIIAVPRENETRDHEDPELFKPGKGTAKGGEHTKDAFIFDVDAEMVNAVTVYVDHVSSLPGKLFIEKRVNYRRWMPENIPESEGYGTADAIIYDKNSDTLDVDDYKHGRMIVRAEMNSQGLMYGLGALEFLKWPKHIKYLRIGIIQPRKKNLDFFTISIDDLLAWAEDILRPAAARAWEIYTNDDLELEPGDFATGGSGCTWCGCNKNKTCKTLARLVMNTVFPAFKETGFDTLEEDMIPQDTKNLSTAELSVILKHVEAIKKFANSLEDAALKKLEMGEQIPGYKMVMGKPGNRAWKDKEKVLKYFKKSSIKKEVYQEESLVSVAQAEMKIPKTNPTLIKLLENEVSRSSGKPCLATDSDKREAMKPDFEFETEVDERAVKALKKWCDEVDDVTFDYIGGEVRVLEEGSGFIVSTGRAGDATELECIEITEEIAEAAFALELSEEEISEEDPDAFLASIL